MTRFEDIGCKRCQDLRCEPSQKNIIIKVSELHYETINGRIECAACKLLWDGVVAVLGAEFHKDYHYIAICNKGEMIHNGPVAILLATRSREFDVELQFYLPHNEALPTPWKSIGKGYDKSPHGLSKDSMQLATQWLDSCTKGVGEHQKCQQPDLASLPTRVIDVNEMRLHLSGRGEKGHYATLSHCWGKITPLRTTRLNLAKHLRGLPSPLPRSFEDAVSVTRALGIQFLWIDSLCIIQDCKKDWLSEAALMASVYENSFVTISADAAGGSVDGFLSVPSRKIRPFAKVEYCYTDKSVSNLRGVVHVRERGKLGLLLPYHGWVDAASVPHKRHPSLKYVLDAPGVPRSRLSTRGWVFQERILSPRTLHFASSEMAWECRSICTCECSATSYRRVRKTSLLKGYLSLAELDDIHALWRVEIIQEYSRLNLTFAEDRLIALSGLAEAVGRIRPGDTYLAGLWRKSLERDLLWSVQPIKPSERLTKCPAPTWSWPSITGAVAYGQHNKRLWMSPAFQVEGIDIVKVDGSPFSASRPDAFIYVKGQVLRVNVKGIVVQNEIMVVPKTYQPLRKSNSGESEVPFFAIWDIFDGSSSRYNIYAFMDEPLVFLLIARQPRGPCGLLLQEEKGATPLSRPIYRRLAYVYANGESPPRPCRRGSHDTMEPKEPSNGGQAAWNRWASLSIEMSLKIA